MNGKHLLEKLKKFIISFFKVKRIENSIWVKSNFIYKNYLRLVKDFNFSPTTPKYIPWINTTLKTKREIELATKILTNSNLNLNLRDVEKNWDSSIALKIILENTNRSAMILDAGGGLKSLILHWLYQFGYKNLKCINLLFRKREKKGNIEFFPGDLTQTHFPDNYFDIITCISVIEHGVNEDQYFIEMNRILKRGGLLITSTDYWESKIETGNIIAYNNPVLIYDKTSINNLLKRAYSRGFKIYGPELDLNCQDKAVLWKRFNLRFTFIIFCLQKE